MYTCRTCKHLQHTRAKKIITEHSVSIASPSIIDALAEWHCPWYWWGSGKPDKGFHCKHWEFSGKKHWI